MKYNYNGREIRPSVEIYYDFIPYAGGITMREYFTEPQKFAVAWRKAYKDIEAEFAGLLSLGRPALPPLSYGHLSCLGCEVKFPEDSDPNVMHLAESLDEAIEIVKRAGGMDFTARPMLVRYLSMWEELKKLFPEYKIPFTGCGAQGPLTSAVLLRGQDFFCDMMEEPEQSLEYIMLMTDSIIAYRRLMNRINGAPEVSPSGAGLADDLAALVPPYMWESHVLPAWDRLLSGLTSGNKRSVHCEGMLPAHLPHLEKIGLTHYQPSVSPALTLPDVAKGTNVPYDWLLYAFDIVDMTDEEIENWVDDTLTYGVSTVRTQFGRYAWQKGKIDRIKAFYKAFDKYSE